MNLAQLQTDLSVAGDAPLQILLPDQQTVAAHFHLTEIGLEEKNFIDCGGTQRRSTVAVLQVFVANDVDHRFSASKLAGIVGMATQKIEGIEKVELVVELQGERSVERYTLKTVRPGPVFVLQAMATACLAPDSCKVDVDLSGKSLPATGSSCDAGSGCC